MVPLLPFLLYGGATAGLLWWASQSTSRGRPPNAAIPPLDRGVVDRGGVASPAPDTLTSGDYVVIDLRPSPLSPQYASPIGVYVRPAYLVGRYLRSYPDYENYPDRGAVVVAEITIDGYTEDPNLAPMNALPLALGTTSRPVTDIVRKYPGRGPLPATAPQPMGVYALAGDVVIFEWAPLGIPIFPSPGKNPGPYAVMPVQRAVNDMLSGTIIGTLQRIDLPIAQLTPLTPTLPAAVPIGSPTIVRIDRAFDRPLSGTDGYRRVASK